MRKLKALKAILWKLGMLLLIMMCTGIDDSSSEPPEYTLEYLKNNVQYSFDENGKPEFAVG